MVELWYERREVSKVKDATQMCFATSSKRIATARDANSFKVKGDRCADGDGVSSLGFSGSVR